MNTRLRGTLAAVAAALVVALAGVVVPALPASAATIGTLELRDAGGRPMPSIDAAQLPSFTTAVATGACPVGFRDATRLAIVAGASTFVASSNQTITDATAPATATLDTPVADYSTAGTLTVRLQCLDIQNGIGVVSTSYYESTLTSSGGSRYAVTPAPTIVVEATTIALAVSPASPVVVGANVVLTATVTRAAITGSVEFFDGGVSLGSEPVSGGVASFDSTAFGLGLHSFTAVFTPNEPVYYAQSTTAAPTVITVVERPTSTTIAVAAPATVNVGTDSVLTANVAPTMAGGSVTFSAGAATLGTAPVVGGVARLSIAGLAAGEYDVTATFTPSNPILFEASTTASARRLVVLPAPAASSIALTVAGPSTPRVGDRLALTATVAPADATGTVEFLDDGVVLDTVGLSGSVAELVIPSAVLGTHSYTARFVPADARFFEGSTTPAPLLVTVAAAPVAVPTPTATPGASTGAPARVAPAAADPDGSLAFTGFAMGGLVLLAVGLLAGGGVLIVSRRRRAAQE